MICQNDWPAAARKSTNRRASAPKSPMPNGPGRDVGCRRTPLERSNPHWVARRRSGSAVRTQQRSTSATLHACATQPRGVKGGSASKISLIEPMQASSRCGDEAVEEAARARAVVGVHLEPRVDERADQPRPDRALVIRGVARAQVAVVASACSRGGRARASAGRPASAASLRTTSSTGGPARCVEHRMRRARSRRSGSAGTPVVVAVARRRPRRRDSRPPAYQKRWLNDRAARARRARRAAARGLVARRSRSQPSSRRSALYQSALISTALPRRGVTTQSSTLASIQVSW